jgi:uncharacterized protein
MAKLTYSILFFVAIAIQTMGQGIWADIENNNYKAVKKHKGDINYVDAAMGTPLMWAIYRSDLKMVKKLVRHGATVQQKGWIRFVDSLNMTEFMYGSCLAVAAGENKTEILKFLLKKLEVPVNDKEINMYLNIENGWNAAHWATVKNNREALEMLVEYGADLNCVAETDHHQTPLHFAIKFHHTDMAKLLIELGADINQKDDYHNSPLLYAMHHKNSELVKLLLEKGARPGVQGLNVNELLLQYFGVGCYGEL